MKIGIVGNREGWDKGYVFKKLKEQDIKKTDLLVTGGADGVDTYAQDYAKKIGAQIRIIYPDPEKPSPDKYFERNEKIALFCDKLIAFNKKEHSGTLNTINHAERMDKEIVLIKNGK